MQIYKISQKSLSTQHPNPGPIMRPPPLHSIPLKWYQLKLAAHFKALNHLRLFFYINLKVLKTQLLCQFSFQNVTNERSQAPNFMLQFQPQSSTWEPWKNAQLDVPLIQFAAALHTSESDRRCLYFFSMCGPNWTQVCSHRIGYIPVPIGLLFAKAPTHDWNGSGATRPAPMVQWIIDFIQIKCKKLLL